MKRVRSNAAQRRRRWRPDADEQWLGQPHLGPRWLRLGWLQLGRGAQPRLAGFTGWVGYGSYGGDHGYTQGGWADTVGGHSHSFSDNPHAHTVASHSHLVPISDHTHSLVYGIFEGPAPSTPGVELHINGGNYTVPLGGPWHGDFEVDITQHLQDVDGQPLRQENVLWFYSNELVDLEITVRSLVTGTSLVPAA